jgi:hypothetical protein
MKKNLLLIVVAMLFATGLTYGQHQSRPLPIYRYMVDGYPDNLNVLDSSVASLALDTNTLPFPAGPALTWGGWDTAHLQTTNKFNWSISHYTLGNINELRGNGYSGGVNIATDQWYISPYFNSNNYSGIDFSFSSKCSSYAGPAMIVMVSKKFKNESVVPADWDTLKTANIPTPNGTASSAWLKSNINLDSYKGDSVCVAFRYTSTTGAAANYYLDSISITGTLLVGINNINPIRNSISVYPNPASTVLYLNNLDGIEMLKVSNILGETIESLKISGSNTVINVSSLSKGIYFISFMNEKGVVETRKFAKE